MNSFLSFALLYCIIGLSLHHASGHLFSGFGWGHSSNARTSASICANSSIPQSYLNQTLALINTFQANASYNAILLLKYPVFVAYLKNTTNQALSSSNCPAFIIGVKTAIYTDDLADRAREQIAGNIQRQFQQASYNATGSSGPNELYSGNGHGH